MAHSVALDGLALYAFTPPRPPGHVGRGTPRHVGSGRNAKQHHRNTPHHCIGNLRIVHRSTPSPLLGATARSAISAMIAEPSSIEHLGQTFIGVASGRARALLNTLRPWWHCRRQQEALFLLISLAPSPCAHNRGVVPSVPQGRPDRLGEPPGRGAGPALQRPPLCGGEPTARADRPPLPLLPEDEVFAPHAQPDHPPAPRNRRPGGPALLRQQPRQRGAGSKKRNSVAKY